eukprot:331532-Prymnesium_polylepis.1
MTWTAVWTPGPRCMWQPAEGRTIAGKTRKLYAARRRQGVRPRRVPGRAARRHGMDGGSLTADAAVRGGCHD